MKGLKKILWVLAIAIIAIQFFRPEKNVSAAEQPGHISQSFPLPSEVKNILAASCSDCHSNNTRYPWYFSVQPMAWWMDSHIHDGKRALNFDEYTSYRLRKQFKRFGDIREVMEENEMPLSSYTFIHKAAILSPEQKEKLVHWSDECIEIMKRSYPMDSLLKKEAGIKQ